MHQSSGKSTCEQQEKRQRRAGQARRQQARIAGQGRCRRGSSRQQAAGQGSSRHARRQRQHRSNRREEGGDNTVCQ
jgi:hypothetical protein